MCRDSSGTPDGFHHQPVLMDEVQSLFSEVDGIVVDATFGGGGHTTAILEANPNAAVIGIDRDDIAMTMAMALKSTTTATETSTDTNSDPVDRIFFVLGAFGDFDAAVDAAQASGFHPDAPLVGVLADLGVSSPQIDRAERGFSYQRSGPLDMRMGGDGQTARELIDSLDTGDLADLLWRLGDEKFSRRIATAVKSAGDIETTGQLADIVEGAVPGVARKRRGHPAARTFQALRIAVNDELGQLDRLLDAAWRRLAVGGRLAVISYHSLEDRMVKAKFRALTHPGQTSRGPERLMPNTESAPPARSLGKWTPRPSEIAANPRARSARLRAITRVAAESPAQGMSKESHDE